MQQQIEKVIQQIEQVVIGKPKQVKLALVCLLAKGHLLIEDLPGMGKTTLAHVLANSLGLSYQRVQFTNDMLPADVIGVSIFDQGRSEFTFHQGPVFNQLVLADEINRASPKTQSALLEAMEENRISIDGNTYQLPEPFFVIATQNPLSHAGTHPLPESQLDRFMMRISLGFPDRTAERQILLNSADKPLFDQATQSIDANELSKLQQLVNEVTTSIQLVDYVIALCEASRQSNDNINPLSPRAGKAIIQAAKAWALIERRDYVIPDDVKQIFSSVCEHRLSGGHFNSDYLSTSTYTESEKLLDEVDSEQPFDD